MWRSLQKMTLHDALRPVFGRPSQVPVRPMLRDRCPICRVCLSVALVYCAQTAGWIKMPLRTEVGLVPGHVVLDADPAPAKKGVQQPPTFRPMSFRPMSIVAKRSPISSTAELL